VLAVMAAFHRLLVNQQPAVVVAACGPRFLRGVPAVQAAVLPTPEASQRLAVQARSARATMEATPDLAAALKVAAAARVRSAATMWTTTNPAQAVLEQRTTGLA